MLALPGSTGTPCWQSWHGTVPHMAEGSRWSLSPGFWGARGDAPGRHQVSSIKLLLPWGDREGPHWLRQRSRAKRHVPQRGSMALNLQEPGVKPCGLQQVTMALCKQWPVAGGDPHLCPNTAPQPQALFLSMQVTSGARFEWEAHLPLWPRGVGVTAPSCVAFAPAALTGCTRPIPGSRERRLCRPSRPIPLAGPPGERRTQDAPGVKERGRRGACQVPAHSSGPLGEPEGNSPLQSSEAGSEIYFCLCE